MSQKSASAIAVIKRKRDSVTAFDVGANRGQTAVRVIQLLPNVTIHSFEPSPSTFAELSQSLAGYYQSVILNNCGMGSQKSEMNLIENTYSVMTSFLELGPEGWGKTVRRIKVPVTTVDDYSAERDIKHIHLLKIDTQGFDFEVIKGAERMLAEGRIDLVLMEVIFSRLYEGLPRFDAIYATWPSAAIV